MRPSACSAKFKRDPYTLHDIRQKLTATCNFIASTGTLDVVKEDPDDNRILEWAEAAHSDYVVPEDKDLLRLGVLWRNQNRRYR